MERALKSIITFLLFVIFALLLYISDAEANAVLQQSFQPTSINRMVSSSSLVTASTRFAGVTAANQSVYAVRAVDIGKASVANAVRTRAFTPWGLGLVAILTAAGYFLEDGQIATQTEGFTGVGQCYRFTSNYIGDMNVADCFEAAKQYWASQPNPQILTGVKRQNITTICFIFQSLNNCANGARLQFPNPQTFPPDAQLLPGNQPVADDALFDLYRDLPPSQQTDLLTDPLTGFPDAATIPEFQQAADSISSNWNANNDGDPATVPDPEAPEQTSEEPFPEEQPEQDICKADPNILACQELGETPDETPIEEMELPIDYQPVSFSSNASCPAPTNMGGGIQYNYDGACQFASGVKPAVITMALISGIYLMGGFRR